LSLKAEFFDTNLANKATGKGMIMKIQILTVLLIVTAGYLYSQNSKLTDNSLIKKYSLKTQKNYSDIYKSYRKVYYSSALNISSKESLYNHFKHDATVNLVHLARVPLFKKVTFKTNPYLNDDLYSQTFYSIFETDLLFISIIADGCDKNNKKLADRCFQALKSRTLLLIDSYPMSSNPSLTDKVVFSACLKDLYKVNGLEDFIKEELKWRIKTLKRRKYTKDILFPIRAIQFALGDVSVINTNKLSKDEKMILRAFIYRNPKIKISKPNLENIGKLSLTP
jgi:hypothetical protein